MGFCIFLVWYWDWNIPQKKYQEDPFGGRIWRANCRGGRRGGPRGGCSRRGGGWRPWPGSQAYLGVLGRGLRPATLRRSPGPDPGRRWPRRLDSAVG